MQKRGKDTKSSSTNNILDFNSFKIKKGIKELCEKFHTNQEFFTPLVGELQKRNPVMTPEEILEELDYFMTIKLLGERR